MFLSFAGELIIEIVFPARITFPFAKIFSPILASLGSIIWPVRFKFRLAGPFAKFIGLTIFEKSPVIGEVARIFIKSPKS